MVLKDFTTGKNGPNALYFWELYVLYPSSHTSRQILVLFNLICSQENLQPKKVIKMFVDYIQCCKDKKISYPFKQIRTFSCTIHGIEKLCDI